MSSSGHWIAVTGDVHGAFDAWARLLDRFERAVGARVDLVLQVGDLELAESVDLGRPVVFIAGNHETWELLQTSEPTPGFTYLGRAGVISRLGLTIGGLSGIHHPRFSEEAAPTGRAGRRGPYFARADVASLLAAGPLDVLLLHDWPCGLVADRGNAAARLLVDRLAPTMVFCGHHHVFHANDLELGSSRRTRVRCLADVPRGGTAAITFLRVNGNALEEAPALEELEALDAFRTSSRPLEASRRSRPSAPRSR